jgi:hypothetical protein
MYLASWVLTHKPDVLCLQSNYRIRRVDPSNNLGLTLGTGTSGFLDGAAASAQIGQAMGLARHPQGGILFADK